MNRFHLAMLGVAALISSCASTVAVRPVVATPAKIDTVCIERNAEVLVDDLLPAVEAAFQRNGIATRVFDVSPAPCPYRVTYAASRRWDLTPFMSDARISVYRERELIGEANYALPSGIFGGGGINPDKWRGTSFKIDPMMDQMLVTVKSPRR
jgi:hypothetical protein